jgi:hypothetical protein
MTMHIVSGRIRLGRSAAAVAAGAFLLALVQVTTAQAAGPEQFRLSEPLSFTDTTSCAFPIEVNVVDNVVGRAFFDAQGNLQSVDLEQNITGTESANGISLPTSSHFVEFLNFATNGAKEVGLTFKVQDGGVAIRDAGILVFNPDGTVGFIAGPHPSFEGDTAALCAALS